MLVHITMSGKRVEALLDCTRLRADLLWLGVYRIITTLRSKLDAAEFRKTEIICNTDEGDGSQRLATDVQNFECSC